jgi:hypothetical protein
MARCLPSPEILQSRGRWVAEAIYRTRYPLERDVH